MAVCGNCKHKFTVNIQFAVDSMPPVSSDRPADSKPAPPSTPPPPPPSSPFRPRPADPRERAGSRMTKPMWNQTAADSEPPPSSVPSEPPPSSRGARRGWHTAGSQPERSSPSGSRWPQTSAPESRVSWKPRADSQPPVDADASAEGPPPEFPELELDPPRRRSDLARSSSPSPARAKASAGVFSAHSARAASCPKPPTDRLVRTAFRLRDEGVMARRDHDCRVVPRRRRYWRRGSPLHTRLGSPRPRVGPLSIQTLEEALGGADHRPRRGRRVQPSRGALRRPQHGSALGRLDRQRAARLLRQHDTYALGVR